MKKFLLTLCLFYLLFFIYDKAYLLIRNYTPKTEFDNRLEMLINGKINKELIIMGSSRGARDIIASRLENKIGLNAYNLSYLGANIEFHEFLLRTLIKFNKIPKFIFLVIDDDSELSKSDLSFRLDRLYPLTKYEYIRQEMVNRKLKHPILSKLFALHQINRYNFGYGKEPFSQFDTMMRCGSMPITFRSDDEMEYVKDNTRYAVRDEIPAKVAAFKSFVQICKQNNIKLTLVFPPNFQIPNLLFEKRIRELAGGKVKLFKFDDKSPIFTDPDYFHDEWHLMKKGAEIFTDGLANFFERECLAYKNQE